VILREDYGYRLIDLSPRCNRVRVNGKRASDLRLGHDDELRIGRLTCHFRRGRPS
jgi:hypothetical protein